MDFQIDDQLEEVAIAKAHGDQVRFDDDAERARFNEYWIKRESNRRASSRKLYRAEMSAAERGRFIRLYGSANYEALPMKKAA